MAKAKSHLFTTMRGSVAGVTYTANTFAAIVARARTNPTNPNSQYQNAIRQAFSNAKYSWQQTLTDAQREAWNEWASTVFLTGPLGQYQVPGRQLYIGIHADRLYLAQRGVTFAASSGAAPLTPGLIPTPVCLVSPPATGIGYKIAISCTYPQLCIAYSSRSRAFEADRYFYHGPFLSSTLANDTQATVNEALEIERTGLVAGKIYFEHLRLIVKGEGECISLDSFLRCAAASAA